MTTLVPTILAGGSGTRLWPISRQSHPKPFMRLPDGESLAEKTLKRASQLGDFVLTITGERHFDATRQSYEAAGADAQAMQFILEPMGRNTAAAIALAALWARDRIGDQAQILVMPADHLIARQEAFAEAVSRASSLASRGYLVTFGIEPDRPETGYGYIRMGKSVGEGNAVDQFVEKPPLANAQAYLEAGGYVWNAGIFCFQVDSLLDNLKKHAADVVEGATAVWKERHEAADGSIRFDPDLFAQLPDISIDYALMEKAEKVAVVPCNIGWSDVGSWLAMSDLTPVAKDGVRTSGRVISVDSENCYVLGQRRLVATVGVKDLAVVETDDAILVADLRRTQDVKQIVDTLKSRGDREATEHNVTHYPWGKRRLVETVDNSAIYTKTIAAGAVVEIHPAAASLTIVHGEVEVEGRIFAAHSTIPAVAGHALHNRTDSVVRIIEIQEHNRG